MKARIQTHKLEILLTWALLLIGPALQAQSEQVKFMAKDKVPVTADLYASNPATAPVIILFHQAKYSRGEYFEVAPKLNKMGFNCLAVDLRSGGEINGIPNKTFNYVDSLHQPSGYTDAYTDMQAAVSYVKKKYPGAKIILFGSSYSASLTIKYAADFPAGISGVVSFSPGEYFSKFGWVRNIIELSAQRVNCPVFITSAQEEQESWKAIYNALPGNSKVSFVPQASGKHGAKVLWDAFPESAEYWAALKKFLQQFK